MNKAFIDTNIAIAFVFYINSLHFKANNVFDSYSDFFWSNFVKNEFNGRFSEKYIHLLNFYHDFQKYLETPDKELYSIFDLNKFVKENYLDKNLKDAISSLEPFWEYYVGVESQVPFIKMQNNIKKCLKDLKVDTFANKRDLENIMNLTHQRTNDYSQINDMLKKMVLKMMIGLSHWMVMILHV